MLNNAWHFNSYRKKEQKKIAFIVLVFSFSQSDCLVWFKWGVKSEITLMSRVNCADAAKWMYESTSVWIVLSFHANAIDSAWCTYFFSSYIAHNSNDSTTFKWNVMIETNTEFHWKWNRMRRFLWKCLSRRKRRDMKDFNIFSRHIHKFYKMHSHLSKWHLSEFNGGKGKTIAQTNVISGKWCVCQQSRRQICTQTNNGFDVVQQTRLNVMHTMALWRRWTEKKIFSFDRQQWKVTVAWYRTVPYHNTHEYSLHFPNHSCRRS